MNPDEKIEQKLIIYIKHKNPFVLTRIHEVDFPAEHHWKETGLSVKDLSIYGDDCEICIGVEDVCEQEELTECID